MMIDFALAAQASQGLSPDEAIRQACLLRFRPIMMTTFSALLGRWPLALGTGPGSELRMPLGIAIVGGLLISQVLTLFTTPVVYLAFEGLRPQARRDRAHEPSPPPCADRPGDGRSRHHAHPLRGRTEGSDADWTV